MKITLRDLFWLTLVVALAVGWFVDAGTLRAGMYSSALQNQATIANLQSTVNQLQQVVEVHRTLQRQRSWNSKDEAK